MSAVPGPATMHPATTAQPDLRGKDDVIDWTGELLDQLDGHWTHQLRPRLDGLTDQEYLWEPVPGCWNVRARGARDSPAAIGSGPFTLDLLRPPPSPACRRKASMPTSPARSSKR